MASELKSTMEELKENFHKRMATFEAELQKSSSTPISSTGLAAEFVTFRSFVTHTLDLLQKQIEAIDQAVDVMETQRRRKILLFHGVKEAKEEDTAQLVTDVITKQLGIAGVTVGDIRRCHRMGRQSSSAKPRPILVKLEQAAIRDKVWFAKTKLKGSGVTLSEFLTRRRHDLFMAARSRLGVNKCWTKDGTVYVLSSSGPQRVVSLTQLSQVAEDAAKPSAAPKITTTRTKRTAATKK